MAVINLLCLPNAGASATMYLRWKRLMPAWVNLVPVELPGRGRRLSEACVEHFDQLVPQLCRENAALMQQPYALFGHSMGALLSWGMACHQRDQGLALPRILFASGTAGPSRRDMDRFGGTSDAELIADMRRQGGTPEEVFDSPELLRMTLDILGADYRLCRSFVYCESDRLPMPLEVLAGRQDDIGGARVLSWQREAGNAFALHWFEGGHFFIRQQETAVLQAILRGLKYRFAGVADAAVATA
jgi:surfactin synthase thioesterase subunit